MARVNKMFQTIRNERETLTELMNVMGTKSLPSQYLILSHEDLRSAIDTFEHAKQADAINELNPPEDENKDTASVYSMSMEE
jgi:serine/threonine-protein phosphatase 2B catalytic subunit